MWKLFCIAGTPEFHTPPTAHSLPAALPLQGTLKVLSGPGQAFAWYLLGDPGSLPPSGKVTRAGHAERKGIVMFWGWL